MHPGKRSPATLAVAGLIGTSSLMGTFAQGADAHRHANGSGRCSVSIEVAPHRITAGDTVVVFGRLRCRRPADAAAQTVRLFHHLPRLPGFAYVQRTTTDQTGFYEFARADGVVDSDRSWLVRSHGAHSASRRIRVAAVVTLSGPAEGQLTTGFPHRVTFTGTVFPADAGSRVTLELQNAATGNRWHRIDSSFVAADGRFTLTHTFVVPGDANIRVLVRSQRRNAPSASDVLAYAISQAQNPELTIEASADPIVFGQSVTISGVLAGPLPPNACMPSPGAVCPEGQFPVLIHLLAHTDRQGFFPPAIGETAVTTADAHGHYTLQAQAPTSSTFYEVQTWIRACGQLWCAPTTSAVLYEGVKDLLTAHVSATRIRAGRTLTFRGTVAPDHSGHIIYLERQNPSGSGFHVVQVGFLAPGSTYAISRRVYDAGTKVFRVFIPGGAENEGAASQSVAIQVTPAPAASLRPEGSNESAKLSAR